MNSLILIGLVILLVGVLVRSRRKRAAAGATGSTRATGRGLGRRRRGEREAVAATSAAGAEAAAASVLDEPRHAPLSAAPLPTVASEPLPAPAPAPEAGPAPSWGGSEEMIVEPGWPLPGEIAGGWSPAAEEAPVAPAEPLAVADEPTWLSEEPAVPVTEPAWAAPEGDEPEGEVAGPPLWTPPVPREPILVEGVDIDPETTGGAPSWHEDIAVPEPEPIAQPEPEPEPEPELVWAMPIADPEPEVEIEIEPVEAMPVYVPAPEAEVEPEPEPELEAEPEAEPAAVATLLVAAASLPPLGELPDRPGVTPRMLAVVRSLAESPRGVTALAEIHGASRSVVSGICARLEEQGLVEKERDASDRRRVVLALTEAGWALHEEDLPASATLERAVARLSASERRALDQGLRALARVSA